MTITVTTVAEKRPPLHLAVLVGLSAGAYAGSLAVVTLVQSTTDASVSAQRAPTRVIADAITAAHNDLEANVADAMRHYGLIADRYGALEPEFATLETTLDALATTTSSVTNSVRTLPTRVNLPKVSSTARVVRAAAPASHATTAASGG